MITENRTRSKLMWFTVGQCIRANLLMNGWHFVIHFTFSFLNCMQVMRFHSKHKKIWKGDLVTFWDCQLALKVVLIQTIEWIRYSYFSFPISFSARFLFCFDLWFAVDVATSCLLLCTFCILTTYTKCESNYNGNYQRFVWYCLMAPNGWLCSIFFSFTFFFIVIHTFW